MDRWLDGRKDGGLPAGRRQCVAMEMVELDVWLHTCRDRTSPFVGSGRSEPGIS